jgi:hypothetical protein
VPGTDFDARVAGADAGLFFWMTKDTAALPEIFGFRHGTRNPYDAAVAPLLLTNQDGVALDRPSNAAGSRLDAGEVVLADVGHTLVVTDTTYANLELSIDAGDGLPPLVVLVAPHTHGNEEDSVYGDGSCAWPAPPEGKRSAPRLRRIDDRVTLTRGAKEISCKGPEGRVSVWLRSPGGEVRIRSIDVKRSF